MKFEHEGRSLWYGTPDALAPGETVAAGMEIVITIGVSPIDASNKVELLYRINQGSTETIAAKWVRNDTSRQAQYFQVTLPALRTGDIVEYLPINGCAGCQIPSPAGMTAFPSSFRVVEPTAALLNVGLIANRTILSHNLSTPMVIQPELIASARPFTPINASVLDTPAASVNPDIESTTVTSTPSSNEPILSSVIDPSITGVSPVISNSAVDVIATPPISVSPSIPISPPFPISPGGGGSGSINRSLSGTIISDQGIPAAGLTLRVYHRGFGGDSKITEIQTDANGNYQTNFNLGTNAANLDVRAVDSQGKEIPLSDTLFNAGQSETMNLVAPSSLVKFTPEFTSLSQELGRLVTNFESLAQAKEGGDDQDITTLHQNTGWDARLIALAATAAKASVDTRDTRVPVEAFYALFRAGLPTDMEQLAFVDDETVEKTLKMAQEVGIVQMDSQQITAAKEKISSIAKETRLSSRVPGTVSRFRELLSCPILGANTSTFADLYFTHRGTGSELWQKARERGISEGQINGLQLQGKLAFLTLGNAKLMSSLQNEIGTKENLALLADKDLFKEDAWKERLIAAAGGETQVTTLVPETFNDATGKASTESVNAYAADMARMVRLSFPTQVIRRMIETNDLHLGVNHDALKSPLQTLLKNSEGLGFELGRVHIDSFLNQHHDAVFQGIAEEQKKDASEGLKTLQRLHQITPSNESLKVLLDQGFTSARNVAAFSQNVFLERFGPLFPSRREAELVFRKAEQVSSVTYNFFTLASQVATGAGMPAVSGSPQVRSNVRDELLKQYPTMESLFGSLDFCECEHCRSVLSPAAYFVDLLQFLDHDEKVWESFLDYWKFNHNGEAYTKSYKKPYDALVERRPDLPHLQLTCENTQTALPYIDVVNEILEYYVANDKLAESAVHDTENATTAELLAEPQNVIPEAYEKLRESRYPLKLPFDLWLETVRRFFLHFETPLCEVLDVFRKTDEFYVPDLPYDRAAIFRESLGVSAAEYALFFDPNPLAKWHELYGYATKELATDKSIDSETRQRIDLNSAKALSRRLGITYKELVEVVSSYFVNPSLNTLTVLRKLSVDAVDVFRYKGYPNYPALSAEEKSSFEKRLDDLTKKYEAAGFNAKTWLDKAWLAGDFNEVLVLTDTNAQCNFDETELRYANSNPVEPLVWIKINLFVRLWKKLGWTIEETDHALQTFLPRNLMPLSGTNIGEAFKTILVYFSHLKTLDEQLKVGRNSRLKLLALWSNLSTTGKNSLYGQLFLTRSVLKADPIFDDPLGIYLAKGGVFANKHILALQSALTLSAEDIRRIFDDVGKNIYTAELSLDTVSILYRYGLLAKALKLPIADLIAVKKITGLDPFKTLSPEPLTSLDMDYPLSQTLRFVEIMESIRASGFSVEDLDYLLRHRFDPIGKYRSAADVPLTLVRQLAIGIRQIRSEHAVPSEPGALTDEQLRLKLSMIFPSEVVDTFMGMWTGSREYEAIYPDPILSDQKLKQEDFADEPAIRVNYDEISQKQRFTYRGVLIEDKKKELKKKFPDSRVGELLDSVHEQALTFFRQYLQKQSIDGVTDVGFLEIPNFDDLFGTKLIEEEKRSKLARTFIPFVQKQLTHQLIVKTLAAELTADLSLTEALLTNTELLNDPGQPGQPLVEAITLVQESGVTAVYFSTSDATGKPLSSETRATIDNKREKPSGSNSVRFEGYLEVPATGAYRFFALLGKKDAEVEFRLGNQVDPVFRGKAAVDGAEISQFVILMAGLPHQYTLDVRNIGVGDITLFVQGENLPKGSLSRLMLYPWASVDRLHQAKLLVAKTLQVIQILGLSERELRYFSTHAADFDNFSLSQLPTHASEDGATGIGPGKLFSRFLRFLDYAALKRELALESDELVDVFENARRRLAVTANVDQSAMEELFKRVAKLTRREFQLIRATSIQLGYSSKSVPDGNELLFEAPDFAQEKGLARLWKALQIVETLGVPVDAVVHWATPSPDFSVARDLRDTVKAHYEPENWQRIAQSIFDKLRQTQRDALVAYVMHKHGFERLERLYEHFLIDPGMEPVVQTSRMRLAISSVQLFIQRCLLNLERQVHPSAINSKHWEWMKRYRVWEANRKIFLFPENWLEPEFRDDKSHLFQELESALLQGDVSNDLAEDAFFKYLKQLEVLAKLDIVTMYCEEQPLDPSSNTLHVIGRTTQSPHRYFYRRYAHQMWTPWEPVTVEIEGDHIAAVVWKGRLHLFWINFLKKPKQNDPPEADKKAALGDIFNAGSQTRAPDLEVRMQLNWSEYFEGKWTPRSSSGFEHMEPVITPLDFNERKEVFIHVSKEPEDGAVWIHLRFNREVFNSGFRNEMMALAMSYSSGLSVSTSGLVSAVRRYEAPWDHAFRVVSKNAPPESRHGEAPRSLPYTTDGPPATTSYSDSSNLQVTFLQLLEKTGDKVTDKRDQPKDILSDGGSFKILPASNALSFVKTEIAQLVTPFFYQDSDNVFFVEPTLHEDIKEWDQWLPLITIPDLDKKSHGIDFSKGGYLSPKAGSLRATIPFDTAPYSRLQLQPRQDWLLNQSTALQFGKSLVIQGGAVNIASPSITTGISASGLTAGGTHETSIASSVSNASSMREFSTSNFVATNVGLNVISGGGLNSSILKKLNI